MRKALKRPVKARRKWTRNPKTRVQESDSVYKRQREKKLIKDIYAEEETGS
jgi:hypothetical protein